MPSSFRRLFILALAVVAGSWFVSGTFSHAEQAAISNAVPLQVRGDIRVEGSDVKVATGQPLTATRLMMDQGASLLLVYPSNGSMQRLTALNSVTVELTADGASDVAGLTITNIPGKIPAGSLASLPDYMTAGAGKARGGPVALGPACTPIHGSVVATDQKKLSWPPVEGVEHYQISLTRGRKTVFQEQTDESHFIVKAGLEPDDYRWGVTYSVDGITDVEVAPVRGRRDSRKTFTVAGPDGCAEVSGLLKLVKDNGDDTAILSFCASRLRQLKAFAESIEVYERIRKVDANDETNLETLYELYLQAGRENDALEVDATLKQKQQKSKPVLP